MRRGDVVIAVLPGEYGKPRPSVIMQDEVRHAGLASCVLVPLTTYEADAPALRITITPDAENGLNERSHAMVDKVASVPRKRVGDVVGHLSPIEMRDIGRALALLLGLAPIPPPPAP